MDTEIEKIAKYIVDQAVILKDKYTDAINVPVEFGCIFCQSEAEYTKFDSLVKKVGRPVEDTQMGYTYLLDKAIKTSAGPLKLLKIRKFDPIRKERGDADFNTNFSELKAKYDGKPNFEMVVREKFEMLRLSDPNFDVMACFSEIPKSKTLEIKI